MTKNEMLQQKINDYAKEQGWEDISFVYYEGKFDGPLASWPHVGGKYYEWGVTLKLATNANTEEHFEEIKVVLAKIYDNLKIYIHPEVAEVGEFLKVLNSVDQQQDVPIRYNADVEPYEEKDGINYLRNIKITVGMDLSYKINFDHVKGKSPALVGLMGVCLAQMCKTLHNMPNYY